jgi:hypothetical protein
MSIINIRPGSVAVNAWNTQGGGGNPVVAADPGENLVHDDASSYVWAAAAGAPEIRFFILAASVPGGIVSISSVKSCGRAQLSAAGTTKLQFSIRRSGQASGSTDQTITSSWSDFKVTMSRPGGGGWLPSDLTDGLTEFGGLVGTWDGSTQLQVTSFWLEVDCVLNAAAIEGFRRRGSLELRRRRIASYPYELRLPTLAYLDKELGEVMLLSHPDLPSRDGKGAHVTAGRPWPVVKLSSELNEELGYERVIVEDLRPYLCTFWDTGKPTRSSAETADGVARLDPGSTRSWTRTTKKWVRSPGDILVPVEPGIDAIDKDGMIFESAATNELTESAFKNGATDTFTDWSKNGTGVNGSDIREDTNELFWDPVRTNVKRSVKFIVGNPPTDTYLNKVTATASVPANEVRRVSVLHKDDPSSANARLAIAVRRNFDNQWWRDSDSTWQAAQTWNLLPYSQTRARHSLKQMNVGANATTLTVWVGVPSASAVAGTSLWCGGIQIENKKFATSQILTETAAVTRAIDRLLVGCPINAPTWPRDRFVLRSVFKPLWEVGEVSGELKTLAYREFDSNNYDWLYYDVANGRIAGERKAQGVVYRAVKALTPVAGTEYEVGYRVVSAEGELGLTPYTLSVWVDKAKGTDAVAAVLAVANSSYLELGSRNAGDVLDGYLSSIEITQQALADAEVQRY